MTSLTDRMKVTIPEGECDGMRVRRFQVTGQSLQDLRYEMEGRGCQPGEYTRLETANTIWMSDTTAERRDHLEPLFQIQKPTTERVLINGLGIGMVLQAALSFEHVQHVDVVEIDPRVIELVGPHYLKDPRVSIHLADAYEQAKKWPVGSHWNVAWHDIWPSICADNLPEMARLHRSYGRRVDWQGSWCKERCAWMRSLFPY